MKKSVWEKRVNRFDTWFDRRRAQTQAELQGKPLSSMIPRYDKLIRRSCIVTAYRSWYRVKHGVLLPVNFLLEESDEELERLNKELPIPMPKDENVVDAVFRAVRENAEFTKFVMANRLSINEVLSKEDMEKLYLLDMVDSATCSLFLRLLCDDETEFMVMEGGLASRVLSSSNHAISAEDLEHVPFRQTYLEFHKPIKILEVEGKCLKAIGVGFYKNEIANCYAVVWFLEPVNNVDSMCSVTFSPVADLHRVIFDEHARDILGFPGKYDRYGTSNIFEGTDTELTRFNAIFNEARDQLLKSTRNIWDFVTSRNIDYETVVREKRDQANVRKYRHLQGKMMMGPRIFKVLKVNKNVKKSDEPGLGSSTALGYSEKVPGSFHKWIYCRTCDRVHRHDLIGKPCRRCGEKVGPISNIDVRKWWHDEYWRGEGPVKEIVREIKD